MNGILVINKEKDYTSRDVVNIVGKTFNTKKVGHTGTLDPMATGVLVLCIGKSLKVVEILTEHDKDYIAKLKLGFETDTLDITGNVTKTSDKKVTIEEIEKCLENFKGNIKQEVPKYSAVKVNGKKLYEYARNNIDVKLPVREVNVSKLDLINYDNEKKELTIFCTVSKGTYIRSLIRDIGNYLGTFATMTSLERTRLGKYSVSESYTLDDIKNNNYKLLDIEDMYPSDKKIHVSEELLFKIKNGQVLDKFFDGKDVMILDDNDKAVAIYVESDIKNKAKPWKMFVN